MVFEESETFYAEIWLEITVHTHVCFKVPLIWRTVFTLRAVPVFLVMYPGMFCEIMFIEETLFAAWVHTEVRLDLFV